MSTKRSVTLKGRPTVNEEGTANETVKPGYLVKGVSVISLQDGTGQVPAAFAMERDELGQGIDDSRQGSGTESAFYASGEVVKVGVYKPGDEVTAFIASGENITEDDYLVSNGDGTLKEGSTSGEVVGRAKETLGVIAAARACRIEIM